MFCGSTQFLTVNHNFTLLGYNDTRLYRQMFCGSIQFLTANHNFILLGHNDTRL